MLCKNPFIRDPTGKVFHSSNKEDWIRGIPFPCGQCLPCRINKRRIWTTRLYLEAMAHADNLPMLCLTYRDLDLPFSPSGKPTLLKRHIQLYCKRLRNAGFKFRYYICGEYGPETQRPHYHALFFGISPLFIEKVASIWSYGGVHVGYDNSLESIQYVAGYVTKKFVNKTDLEDDRLPEFSLMSRKPAIGSQSLGLIVNLLEKHPEIMQSVLDNCSLRINGKFAPLGRTLSDKLRAMFDSYTPNDNYLFNMRKLWIEARNTYNPSDDDFYNGPLVQALLEESRQRNVQIDKHCRIFNTRNKL